jgi:hypothetical protein
MTSGGGNLILRRLVSRPTTKDLDLLGERTLLEEALRSLGLEDADAALN